jgi:hypothetical protein
MCYVSEQAVLNCQYNAALEAQITEQARRAPHVLLRPAISLDGNMYCVLYGEDLMSGCAGFGSTLAEAMADFDKNWVSAKAPTPARKEPQ